MAACRGDAPEARAEAAALERRNDTLRDLLAAAERGALFPDDRLAVGIDETLLRDLLKRHLPIEAIVIGEVRVRLETADLSLVNGQSLVTLGGRVSALQDPRAFAEVRLRGGLGRFEVDAATGLLRARVDLDRVEVERLEAGGVERRVSQALAEVFGGRSLGALGDILPALEIPVRLEQAIDFGGFSGGTVSIRPKRLPLRASVSRVMSVGGRLFVLLDVSTGDVSAAAGREGP